MTALPECSLYLRRTAGIFNFQPPDIYDYWRAATQRRWFESLALAAGLPADTAPEYVLLMSKDDEGELLTLKDMQDAEAVCFDNLQQ